MTSSTEKIKTLKHSMHGDAIMKSGKNRNGERRVELVVFHRTDFVNKSDTMFDYLLNMAHIPISERSKQKSVTIGVVSIETSTEYE